MTRGLSAAVLALCLVFVLAAAGAVQAAELSLTQAEADLKAAEGLPSKQNWAAERRGRIKRLEAAFRRAAVQHPGRAYQGLGRCELLRGRYREAARWFRKAVRATPGNRASVADLRQAERFATIAEAAGRQLAEGTVVLQVAPLPGDAPRMWAVLTAAIGPARSFTNDNFYEGARLRLLQETARRPKLVWRSEVLQVGSGPGPGWTNDISMYLLDERPLKVLVEEVSNRADSAPSHVDAFAWQGGKLTALPVRPGKTDLLAPPHPAFPTTRVVAFDSEIPPWIVDLGHDGQHEVVTLNRIGSRLSIAAMVFWPSVYAYDRGAYVLADERFPEAYVETGREIQQRLREHPDDYELLKYLGIYYEIQGDRKAALEAYRRAEAVFTAQGTNSADAQSELADLRARIRRTEEIP